MKNLSVFVAVAALLGPGCLVDRAKRPLLIEDVRKIEEGKTTRAEITEVYGEPQKISLTGNVENWCYWHREIVGTDQFLLLQFEGDVVTAKALNDAHAQNECWSVVPDRSDDRSRGVGQPRVERCSNDAQCGAGGDCVEGVCTGGIGPQRRGRCVTGNMGRRLCTNTGDSCFGDHDCL